MTARAVGGVFKGPRYPSETITQMDVIGVGSLDHRAVDWVLYRRGHDPANFSYARILRCAISDWTTRRDLFNTRAGAGAVRLDGNRAGWARR